jgi:hypothetical protein
MGFTGPGGGPRAGGGGAGTGAGGGPEGGVLGGVDMSDLALFVVGGLLSGLSDARPCTSTKLSCDEPEGLSESLLITGICRPGVSGDDTSSLVSVALGIPATTLSCPYLVSWALRTRDP